MRTGLAIVLLAGILHGLPARATDDEPTVTKALTRGKVNADLRYRYESVDQKAFSEDALASTLRLRLGYRTGGYRGFHVFAEFEGLKPIGADQYNSTANGKTQFPVVADPEDEEINQIYLAYTGLEDTTFRIGRQRITLDNQRFIGAVGWRQLEQTFDAFSVKTTPLDHFSFFYAHVNNANRVFGENHPSPAMADTNLNAELINARYDLSIGKITAYVYLLEFEDAPATSQKTIGIRFSGARRISDEVELLYSGEFAEQSDYKDGASTIDVGYSLIELGVKLQPVAVKVGVETLEGDGTYAFQTPLATLYAFNGWTDQFLTTPLTGLEDIYLVVSTGFSGVEVGAALHDFGADAGSADYGTEWGVSLGKTYRKHYDVGFRYASYDADSFSSDTDKLWVTLGLKFD